MGAAGRNKRVQTRKIRQSGRIAEEKGELHVAESRVEEPASASTFLLLSLTLKQHKLHPPANKVEFPPLEEHLQANVCLFSSLFPAVYLKSML